MEKLLAAVEAAKEKILAAERYLWENPAPGYKEWKANDYLAEQFEALGYELNRAGDIPGFTAQIDTGRPGPCVMVMSELDSLIVPNHPECSAETGAVHACGHHAQGAAMLGLATALKAPGVLDDLCGSIRLCIVPAEELIETTWRETLRAKGTIEFFGGKIEFMRRGFFDGVDMAFMIHAANLEKAGKDFSVELGNNGCLVKNIAYEGVSAHAGGSPHEGINALYAANVGLAAINALRETFLDDKHVRVHPIITRGGAAVNAIPADVGIESYVRAEDSATIRFVNEKVNRALAGSAAALGANVFISDRAGYSPLHNDREMSEIAYQAMQKVTDPARCELSSVWSTGSTDMGDVSSIMPAMSISVGGAVGTAHGADFGIGDPVACCVKGAQVEAAFVYLLLSENAASAKKVMEGKTYPTAKEFLASLHDLERDVHAVSYNEDGSVTLAW